MSLATSPGMEERGIMPSLSSSMLTLSSQALAKLSAGTQPVNMPPYAHQQRRSDPIDLSLFELDPREVVDGVLIGNNMFLAPDPISVGVMSETCPHCAGEQLQLVLRRHHVKRSHLFCAQCTRCYDVLRAGGYSFLDLA